MKINEINPLAESDKMSISTVKVIMDRISVSTKETPIAVFKIKEKCGKLDAVFGSTIMTQRKIASGDESLIGVFHGGMSKEKILLKLRSFE